MFFRKTKQIEFWESLYLKKLEALQESTSQLQSVEYKYKELLRLFEMEYNYTILDFPILFDNSLMVYCKQCGGDNEIFIYNLSLSRVECNADYKLLKNSLEIINIDTLHEKRAGYGTMCLNFIERIAKINAKSKVFGDIKPCSCIGQDNLKHFYLKNGYTIDKDGYTFSKEIKADTV